VFSYEDLLQILNKIIRTFPSTASLVSLFKSKRLKQFSAFSEFLVLKIYTMGFLNWSYYNESKKPKLDLFEEVWTQYDSKDLKVELKPEDNQTKFRVKWERKQEWENIIVESMRTLIDFNIFMTPQEKKIKLDIKKYFINAILDKASKSSSLTNLKMISSLASSLILLRKLLFIDDEKSPLVYNKENVCHTISKLKSNSRIFKILGELLKNIHPLSSAADILSPLLIPLIDRMTFSEEFKKDLDKPIIIEMEQDLPVANPEVVEIQNYSDEGQDYDFLGLDEQSSNNEVAEQEEEEEEEEEHQENEPFVEENDTESENVSLDDLIEELKYEGENDSESENEDDEDEGRNRDEIMENRSSSDVEDVDSEEDEEEDIQGLNDDVVEIEVDQVQDIEEIFGGEPALEDNDIANEFEMELFDMSNAEMLDHLRGMRRNRTGLVESNDEEDDDEVIEVDEQDFGSFRQLMNIINRREGNNRINPFLGHGGHLGRQMRGPGYYLNGHGGRNRRHEVEGRRQGQGLESLYQIIDQNQNENELSIWTAPVVPEREDDNRNRNDRRLDLLLNTRFDENHIGRDLERLRAQFDELNELGEQYGIHQ